ncbi:alpha/beta fold hydrolase [Ruania zhangjianzhongii]|uniref:alpha/beta fold hydrolase n=1 Tax=Ruania zhangjianzhongii TaxID=2603206 RepID=UPI00143D5940|nr:alpha/beta fold hydrolase [Ruania zhangjianzhongii]
MSTLTRAAGRPTIGNRPRVSTPTSDRRERRLGLGMAAVLLVDAALHLYWATGAVWPAPDEFSLSVAVLGFGVDFRPGLLIPLAVLVSVGAGLVAARALLGRGHRLGLLWQLGTAAVTAGVLTRGLLGVLWAIPATGHLPDGFYWINLLAYTPLCLAMAIAGFRLLRPARATGWRRTVAVRTWALALPVVLVALLVYGAYGLTPRVVEDYAPVHGLGGLQSQYVDTELARFHYVQHGQGSPVVLLSPGAAWISSWLPQIRALAADHTVYAVDLPGQGFTDLHDEEFRFDLPGMTSAVQTFLDAVGLERTALAGSSWSGGWALSFAQQHPERVSRLMLLAPSGLDRPDPTSWEMLKLPVIGRALTRLGASSRATADSSLESLFVHDDRITDELAEGFFAAQTRPDNVRSMYELQARLDWSTVEAGLATTEQPTLVLWGGQDSVLPVDRAAVFGQLLPNATVRVFDDCGHGLPLDCPGRISTQMVEFLP